MPRTRSTKNDDRTPLEKLRAVDKKIDLHIFFQYYDGLVTEGTLGFQVMDKSPVGSTKHFVGVVPLLLTKNQFRSKAKRMFLLAKAFRTLGEIPPDHFRPTFEPGEINAMKEANVDRRTPMEKLDEIDDQTEMMVFFKYHDGYKTKGRVGFSEKAGPPGSINHFRSVHALAAAGWDDSHFRSKSKTLAAIAKEFVENNIDPPGNRRPPPPVAELPWGMMELATNLQVGGGAGGMADGGEGVEVDEDDLSGIVI